MAKKLLHLPYNRYAILPNLPEANDDPNKNMAHNNVNTNINTRISKDSTYNGIQKRVCGKTKHPLYIRRQRNTAHQLNLKEAHSTSTWEQETNMIPIIVNGQINATKEDSKTNDAINKLDHIHKLVTESTVEVTKSRTKYS